MTVTETEIVETETVTEETRTPAVECYYCGDATPKSKAIYDAIDIGEWKTIDRPCGITEQEIIEAIEEDHGVATLSPVEVEELLGWAELRAYCPDCAALEHGYVRENLADPIPLKDEEVRIEYDRATDAYYIRTKDKIHPQRITNKNITGHLRRTVGPAPWPLSWVYLLGGLFGVVAHTVQRRVERLMSEWIAALALAGTVLCLGGGYYSSPATRFFVFAIWTVALTAAFTIAVWGHET